MLPDNDLIVVTHHLLWHPVRQKELSFCYFFAFFFDSFPQVPSISGNTYNTQSSTICRLFISKSV